MPKKQPTYLHPAKFNAGIYDAAHRKNLSTRAKNVERLYRQAIQKMAQAAQPSLFAGTVQEFSWHDFPQLEKEINMLAKGLTQGLQLNIEQGDKESWALANTKNDAMVASMIGKTSVPKAILQTWNAPNLAAMNAFIQRKEAGMGLSGRVWSLGEQFKAEMELALETCIGKGMSAADISREIRQYLKYPDKLFRRVRDEQGVLRLSKAAEAFHPGTGVYRSSYKNALRMTATENNMAYRTCDHGRWNGLPFVLGQMISTSNNHPLEDICDDLAGRYPKEFLFVGWHPWCRCYAVAILADQKEMDEYTKALMNGEDVSGWKFTGEVKEMPEQWNNWMEANAERIGKAAKRGKLPYFLRDNFTDGDPTKGLKWMQPTTPAAAKKLTPLQIAAKRHAARTPEQAQAILKEWRTRQASVKYSQKILNLADGIKDIDTKALAQALQTGEYAAARMQAQAIAKELKELKHLPYIENPIAAAKTYGMKEVQQASEAIMHKMYGIAQKPLAQQGTALDYEAHYVATHKKYSTWRLAEAAYKKEFAYVEDKLEWEELKNKFQQLKAYATKSKPYISQLDITETYIAEGNKLYVKNGIKHLEDLQAKAEAKKAKAAAAKAAKTAPAPTPAQAQKQPKLDIGNTATQKDHVGNYKTMTDKEVRAQVMKDTGCDSAMADRYADAVYSFSYQWDYEIRHLQTGDKFTSHHGHTMAQIRQKAKDLEDYIDKAPKWNGGTTYRGMSLSDKELKSLMADLKNGQGDMLGSSSWSTKDSVAEHFSEMHCGEYSAKFKDEKTNSVVLVAKKQNKATSIQHMSRYGSSEAEVLSSKDVRWQFVKTWEQDGYTYIEVTPAN